MARYILKILSLCSCTVLVLAAGTTLPTHAPLTHVHFDGNSPVKSPDRGIDEVDSLLMYETFTGGIGNWTTADLTAQATWHVDDYNHYTGGGSTLSWWVGDSLLNGYDNYQLQYLVSPSFSLVGAQNPVLEFDAFWAIENPNGPPPPIPPYTGYDGANVWISSNGGGSWSVLPVQSPIYNVTRLGSFEGTWGIPGITPGWAGYSGGGAPGQWVHCTATIPSAAFSPTVRLRWAFASDEQVCTREQSLLKGFFVDNIYLHDGSTTHLQNNAEGIAVPGDMFAVSGMGSVGNLWHVVAVTYPPAPSAPNVMRLAVDSTGLYVQRMKNVLISPRIDLRAYAPNAFRIAADFYVRGSVNVNDPDTSASELDFWTVQISPDSGLNWYFYSNPFNMYGDSNRVVVDAPSNYTLFSDLHAGHKINLSPYGGRVINMRIYFESNADLYLGSGLFLDNVVVGFDQISPHDAAASDLWIPMPTSLYVDSIRSTVQVHNLGSQMENSIPISFQANTFITPMLPYPSNVQPGQTVLKTYYWHPPAAGTYDVTAFTSLGGDTSHGNDVANAGDVEITPVNVLEFGYDSRQYSTNPFYSLIAYETGSGACVKFTPQADGIPVPMNGLNLKALFDRTGTLRIHLYQPGTATTPGPEVTNFDVQVTSHWPNWQMIPINSVSFLQNTNTDFWVWFEVTNVSQDPILTGAPILHGQGHFFSKSGSVVQSTTSDMFVRAIFAPLVGVEPSEPPVLPLAFDLDQNHPNPFNPATVIPYTLPRTAWVRLSVYDVGGRLVATLVNGEQTVGKHQAVFDGSGLASGIYIYTLTAGDYTASGKMALLK
jgi:hypothetical protein